MTGVETHTTRLNQSGKVQGPDAATLLEEEQRKLIQINHKQVPNHGEIQLWFSFQSGSMGMIIKCI